MTEGCIVGFVGWEKRPFLQQPNRQRVRGHDGENGRFPHHAI
ncbi:MAG: hypothetical protein R3C62_25425 [Chloroflexota bacterium]